MDLDLFRKLGKMFIPMLIVTCALALVAAPIVVAQTATPTPVVGPSVPAPDITKAVTDGINYFFLVATPFVVFAFRKYVWEKAPRVLVMLMPYAIATAISAVAGISTGGMNFWQIALIGGGAHILRELATTIGDHGLS